MKEGVKLKVGDKVRYIGRYGCRQFSLVTPPIDTIGIVMGFDECTGDPNVQWPHGSTSGVDRWCCHVDYLELVERGTDDLETRVRLLEERVGELEHIAAGVTEILSARK